MSSKPFEPFSLPNGTKLKNRIGKAAMEEKLADVVKHNQPTAKLEQLYRAWGEGGSGLILSGHVMIDPKCMACPGDVLLAEDAGEFNEKLWRDWIDATQRDGAQFWLQLNHPGRQVMKGSGLPVYGPSAVSMKMGALSTMFATPIAMTEEQIRDVIKRFAWAARKAEELGASGVEIHAAHGYLISQFLSPISNQRTDQWGGPLENRARLLFETIRAVRAAVSSKFGVGVKINTADFQRGGFAPEEFIQVVKQLDEMRIDMLEVSGGNYESPAMFGSKASSSTARREAYFLEAAETIKKVGTVPIMVTGGITRRKTVDAVLESSDRFIAGVGTAMGLIPDLPHRWEQGEDPAPTTSASWVLSGPTAAAAHTASVQYNMQQVATGSAAWHGVWPMIALLFGFVQEASQMRAYKRWVSQLV